MRNIIFTGDVIDDVSILTDNYVFACIDDMGDIVVTYDCFSDESLSKLYFALSNEMNSRLLDSTIKNKTMEVK